MLTQPHAFLRALAILALVCTACTPKKDSEPPKPKVTLAAAPAPSALAAIGPAPAWRLNDVNGSVVTSDQFKGKVVVLDFWATWCGPCREEIPGYTDLQRKYGKDGLVIVGISVDQGGPDVVKQFIAQSGMNYQVVMADESVLSAFGGIDAYPTTFLIDRAGQIRDRKVGVEATEDYEKKITALLN